MERSCPQCPAHFTTKRDWRTHLTQAHPKYSHFGCSSCAQRFKHEVNLRRHVLQQHPAQEPPLEPPKRPSTPEPAGSSKRARFNDSAELQSVLGGATTFSAWRVQYNKHRHHADPSLSLDTGQEVERVVMRWTEEGYLNRDVWATTDIFLDTLDGIQSELIRTGVTLKTVGAEINRISWYGRYLLSQGRTPRAVVSHLQARASELLNRANHEDQCLTGIHLLDPEQLVELRNRIVAGLRTVQPQLDDTIRKAITAGIRRTPELLRFGANILRCWWDLAVRFTNVPLRSQATRDLLLVTPVDGRYVAKLVFKQGRFQRLVDFDKVGNAHKPVEMPLDDTLSLYLLFYLRYCRPEEHGSQHVFVNPKGGVWNRMSEQCKAYLKDTVGIEPEELDPTGRFIHASRTIGLAAYAVACDFDMEQLRRFAILMRHSFAVMNKHYLTWSRWYQARTAMREFAGAMGIQHHFEQVEHTGYKLGMVQLATPAPDVVALLEREMKAVYGHCEKETTTDPEVESPCCQQVWVPKGPLASSREKNFGQYWQECPGCCAQRWLPLGAQPLFTRSAKPRNLDAVVAHWRSRGLTLELTRHGW